MCGRYTVNTEDEIIEMRQIIQEISIRISKEAVDNYDGFDKDVCPSGMAPIITLDKEIIFAKWGFDKWDGKGLIFNARREGVNTSKFFFPHFLKGRCIVPASSYYEWLKLNKKESDKYRIFDQSSKPIYMAGLMREYKNAIQFVVITCPPADNISFIHNRMPLLLNEDQIKIWLSDNFDEDILVNNIVEVNYEKVG